MNILNSTATKVGVGFAAGALFVGGISNAAPSITPGSKACVTSTNALYLSKNGVCGNGQKLVSISGDSIDVSAIAATAGPSGFPGGSYSLWLRFWFWLGIQIQCALNFYCDQQSRSARVRT
jgi:hypothetical protein